MNHGGGRALAFYDPKIIKCSKLDIGQQYLKRQTTSIELTIQLKSSMPDTQRHLSNLYLVKTEKD